MFCQIIQEWGGAHGEGRTLIADLPRHFRGGEDILQNRRAAQHDGQHNAIHEAKLMRQGGGHVDHIIHAKPKPFGEILQIGQHGVGTMHDTFGLTGGAAGVKKLDHLIRAGTIGWREGRGRCCIFKQPRKTIGAVTPDHENMRELRQVFA